MDEFEHFKQKLLKGNAFCPDCGSRLEFTMEEDGFISSIRCPNRQKHPEKPDHTNTFEENYSIYINDHERNIYSIWLEPLPLSFSFNQEQLRALRRIMKELRRMTYLQIKERFCNGKRNLLSSNKPPEIAKDHLELLNNVHKLPASVEPPLPDGTLSLADLHF